MDNIYIGVACDGFTVIIGSSTYHVSQEMDGLDIESLKAAFIHANQIQQVPVKLEEVY